MKNKEELLKEMQESIGAKAPIEFFANMVNLFDVLFAKIEQLSNDLDVVRTQSALAIQWDKKVASNMLKETLENLRRDGKDGVGNIFHSEISSLKSEIIKDEVTQNYNTFVNYWIDTLGYHPFVDSL